MEISKTTFLPGPDLFQMFRLVLAFSYCNAEDDF